MSLSGIISAAATPDESNCCDAKAAVISSRLSRGSCQKDDVSVALPPGDMGRSPRPGWTFGFRLRADAQRGDGLDRTGLVPAEGQPDPALRQLVFRRPLDLRQVRGRAHQAAAGDGDSDAVRSREPQAGYLRTVLTGARGLRPDHDLPDRRPPAGIMIMSRRDAGGPEEHELPVYPTGGASNLTTTPSSAFVGAG